jgi:hypothetical protein
MNILIWVYFLKLITSCIIHHFQAFLNKAFGKKPSSLLEIGETTPN